MIFIDTNYFLRFLLNDISEQHNLVKNLFIKASEGKEKLLTSTVVFFEVYWVLSSYYEKEKLEIINTLNKILKLTFIKLEEKDILLNSLTLFSKTNLDLEDCYNIHFAKSKKVNLFETFDKKLEKEFLNTKVT
jgi:predicted nucleic-acid-binding protein